MFNHSTRKCDANKLFGYFTNERSTVLCPVCGIQLVFLTTLSNLSLILKSINNLFSFTIQEWDHYIQRFHKMFRHSEHTEFHVVVGNHDIGFHPE